MRKQKTNINFIYFAVEHSLLKHSEIYNSLSFDSLMRVESTKFNSLPGLKGSSTFIMNLILKPDSDVHFKHSN